MRQLWPWEFSEATAAMVFSVPPASAVELLTACYQDGLLMLWVCYRLSGEHNSVEMVQFS